MSTEDKLVVAALIVIGVMLFTGFVQMMQEPSHCPPELARAGQCEPGEVQYP